MIREIDQAYSFFSRISADVGGPLEWAWGTLMSRGNINSLFFSDMLAGELASLVQSIPLEAPVISAYPVHAQIAARAGFQKVINLVPDNYPQYFVLAPGALNLLQGPAAYGRFRDMGVPAKDLEVAGHWVSESLATNAGADSEARIKRAENKQPRRVLLPIGGAGAQKKYVLELLGLIKEELKRGDLYLFLNTGDHEHVYSAIKKYLGSENISHESVTTWSGLKDFCGKHDLTAGEPDFTPAVTLFHFDSHFAAFAATDLLMRVSDVLATKPSELAFFPIPKLFLRRVGDHEAQSALRSEELGEGTVECREPARAAAYLNLLCKEKDLFVQMNENVADAAGRGIYDGAKQAVELTK